MSECSKRVRYRVEHGKIKFISTSGWHVIFYLLYIKHTQDNVFDDFQRFSKIVPKARRTFRNILQTFSEDCRRLPKITEDFRGRAEDVSIIQQDISEYFLRDHVAKAMVIMLFSYVKISCLHNRVHLIFTGVYIINLNVKLSLPRVCMTFVHVSFTTIFDNNYSFIKVFKIHKNLLVQQLA